jgi:hypothetical protein
MYGRPVDFARAQGLLRFAVVALQARHGHLQAAPPVVSRAAAKR